MERVMTDAEREERAIWKVEQGGYHVQRQGGHALDGSWSPGCGEALPQSERLS